MNKGATLALLRDIRVVTTCGEQTTGHPEESVCAWGGQRDGEQRRREAGHGRKHGSWCGEANEGGVSRE